MPKFKTKDGGQTWEQVEENAEQVRSWNRYGEVKDSNFVIHCMLFAIFFLTIGMWIIQDSKINHLLERSQVTTSIEKHKDATCESVKYNADSNGYTYVNWDDGNQKMLKLKRNINQCTIIRECTPSTGRINNLIICD